MTSLFVEHFASGVDPGRARVLHAVQQPISLSTFDDVMGAPAWRSIARRRRAAREGGHVAGREQRGR